MCRSQSNKSVEHDEIFNSFIVAFIVDFTRRRRFHKKEVNYDNRINRITQAINHLCNPTCNIIPNDSLYHESIFGVTPYCVYKTAITSL